MSEQKIDYTLEEQVKGLIDQLDAYISHYHGGSVELVDFDGENVQFRLGGACMDCPISETTGKGWIEGTLRQFFPELKNIIQIQ